ncbi:UNVERIFIED_CONTAM: hypothetical protein GTU68_061218 [Idotea baltica]|nr:hypothetical protein [Idotea baltica]
MRAKRSFEFLNSTNSWMELISWTVLLRLRKKMAIILTSISVGARLQFGLPRMKRAGSLISTLKWRGRLII